LPRPMGKGKTFGARLAAGAPVGAHGGYVTENVFGLDAKPD